jgi:cadmium resistance protein CadD (predicted permease)
MEIILTILVAVSAFIATNLDDMLILIAFFAREDFNNISVVIGQYIGVSFLIIISSFAYFFKFIIPQSYIALLGILPIAIGLKNLWNLKEDGLNHHLNDSTQKYQDTKNYKNSGVQVQNTLKVATVTFVNGGDNIGVYIPIFATMDVFQLFLTISIFVLMIGLWCITSYFMVINRLFGYKLQRYGHIILPFVLIFIGIGIISGGVQFYLPN